MQFSIFFMASLTTLASALPANTSPAHELAKRNPVCGYFYDVYLGDSTGWYVYGDYADNNSGCQNLRKPGENPNDQSVYMIVLDNPACQYCKVYANENCNGQEWILHRPFALVNDNGFGVQWSAGKSFRC